MSTDETFRALRDARRKIDDATLRRRRALRLSVLVGFVNAGVAVGWAFIGLWIAAVASHGDRGGPIALTCSAMVVLSVTTGACLADSVGGVAVRNDELRQAQRDYEDVEL